MYQNETFQLSGLLSHRRRTRSVHAWSPRSPWSYHSGWSETSPNEDQLQVLQKGVGSRFWIVSFASAALSNSSFSSEVKAEIRDDAQRLTPSPNNLFELFLLTIEGSTHSDGSSGKMRKYPSVPGPAPSSRNGPPMSYQHAAYQFDNSSEFLNWKFGISIFWDLKKVPTIWIFD